MAEDTKVITTFSEAFLLMPSNSDIGNGVRTTSSGLLDTLHTRNFSRPDAAVLTSPIEMKTELDSNEPGDMSAEFQESGSLLAPLTGEIPAYSILLYRQGSPAEQEEGLDQLMPQACSQSLSPSSTPFKVQSFLLAQGQTQSQPFISPGLCQPVISSSQAPNNMVINPQQMDPVWLQILSNILAKPSDIKGENNYLVSDVYPGVCHVPKACVSQVQGGANELKNRGEGFGAKPKLRVQLAKTSSIQPSQIKNVSLDVPKGQFVLLSPMSNSPKVQVRSLPPTIHQASTNVVFPSVNNKLNTVTNRYVNLNSSGEESQQPSPLKSDLLGKESLNNSLENSKLSDYSIPLLPSSPLLENDVGGGPMRESHNMKERRRRARIKDACNLMRQLVPGMSKKTDKATVFEFSARYIHFLKSFVGANNDKDFLVKYNPY